MNNQVSQINQKFRSHEILKKQQKSLKKKCLQVKLKHKIRLFLKVLLIFTRPNTQEVTRFLSNKVVFPSKIHLLFKWNHIWSNSFLKDHVPHPPIKKASDNVLACYQTKKVFNLSEKFLKRLCQKSQD